MRFLGSLREGQLGELGIRAADVEHLALHWTSKFHTVYPAGLDDPGVFLWVTAVSATVEGYRRYYEGAGQTELASLADALTKVTAAVLVVIE